MSVHKEILNNGLTIVVDQNILSKTATIKYVVAAGSLDETCTDDYDNRGVAHFTEHMLFKGTKKRNVDAINNDIAAIGGITNAYTSFDRTCFYISSPADRWKDSLEILNDIIWNSTIPPEEVEKERTVIIEELKMYDDDPSNRCVENLDILFNDKNINRQRVAGTIDTVRQLTAEDIKQFMSKFYVPNNIALVVSGNVPINEFVNNVKHITPNISSTGTIDKRNDEYQSEDMNNRFNVLTKGDVSQSHLAFAIKGVPPYDKRFATQQIIANLLGGGFTSRLYNIIREQQGLAYTVSTHLSDMRDASYIVGYCGLDGTNIEKVHKIIATELNKLKRELVSEKELDILKSIAKGTLLLGFEKTSAKTSIHEDNFIYGTNDTEDSLLSDTLAVTAEDIQAFAKEFFTKEHICFSIVKPKEGK